MKKNYFVIGYLLIQVFCLKGQDIHFSQFNENPALINPALTGAYNPLRASFVSRQQWKSVTAGYTTNGASFETRFKPASWQQVDRFRSMTFKERTTGRLAAGLSIYSDKAGDGSFGQTKGKLSLASFVPVSKSSFLSLGIQAALVQRRLNADALLFPNQFNGYTYDPSMASRENFSTLNFNYTDLSTGILWHYRKSDRRVSRTDQVRASMGFSVYHLTRPRLNFFDNNNRIYRRFVWHGDAQVNFFRSDWSIAPSFLTQFQGRSLEIIVGSMLRYVSNNHSRYTGYVKRNAMAFGLFYRNRDAFIFNTQLEWQEQWAMGLSYDINISKLAPASSARGGWEISMRYTLAGAYLYQMKSTAKPRRGRE
jgi:type IX secretion system PorP/SprF family membrane protein